MVSIELENLLDKHGLLCHSFAYNDLPKHVQNQLCDTNNNDFRDCSLTLLANVGPTFWSELIKAGVSNEDRVDFFSLDIVRQLLQITSLANDAEILYPGKAPAPLIQLGELAHWSTPSPLGLGLHSTYGPWLAYRALIKTTRPLRSNSANAELVEISSPCLTCESTPCVTACPSEAVSLQERFNISRCADYRVQQASQCLEQCHARNACPVGIEYRYSDEQHAYHMTHALQALVSWAAKS